MTFVLVFSFQVKAVLAVLDWPVKIVVFNFWDDEARFRCVSIHKTLVWAYL